MGILFGGRLCSGEYINSEFSLLMLIQRVRPYAAILGLTSLGPVQEKMLFTNIFCQYIILTGELRF